MSRTVVGALAIAGALLFAFPESAAAWGPASHVHLGLQLVGSLDLFPPHVAVPLARHTCEFLYGCIAADIPVGKSYAPEERHPHSWRVGRELLAAAGSDDRLRACSLGYLCHLAADVGAHGSFVPRRLLLTSATRSVGHSYWEHRVDLSVGPDAARLTGALALRMDHGPLDRHLDRVLDRGLLSFGASRRVFRGVVRIADNERWQSIFDTLVEQSRWQWEEPEARRYLAHAFELSAGFLARPGASEAERGDPTGGRSMARAKRIRRRILLEEGMRASDEVLLRAADRYFPRPEGEGRRWSRRGGTPDVAERVREALKERALPRAG